MKMLLDTNFFIDIVRFRIDLEEISSLILEHYQLITLDVIVKELEKIANSRKNECKNAKIALKIIEMKKIEILKSNERNVDKAILNIAGNDIWVATNDKKLKNELKKNKVKVISIRSKKFLKII